jgi:hypothetical protein
MVKENTKLGPLDGLIKIRIIEDTAERDEKKRTMRCDVRKT